MGFPTKNDRFEVFWGYHHLRKQPTQFRTLHPGRLTLEHNHGGLVQIIFLSKWVMAVGSMLIFQGVF